MKRRLLLKLGVYLLVGAIVNVGVAWGWSVSNVPSPGMPVILYPSTHTIASDGGLVWMHAVQTGAGHTFVVRWAGVTGTANSLFRVVEDPAVSYTPRPPSGAQVYWSMESNVPPWSIAARTEPRTVPDDNDPQFELATGWPLRSMITFFEEEAPLYFDDVSYGVVVSGFKADGKPFRILPLSPLFPGFAINTIFYAAILWLLLAAPGAVRRSLRRRRGQCPACAYPVGASAVCSECGKPVKAASVEPVA